MESKHQETLEKQISTFLSFRLNKEIFAADVSNVLNILEMKSITKVPQAPEYMLGVINLRGNVLPVVDLRIKFNLEDTSFTKDTCIIVLNVEIDGDHVMLGAVVDAVKEVIEIESDQIEQPPSIGTKYRAEFLKGMWRKDDYFIMLLNIDLIFSTEELLIVNEASELELEEETDTE